MSALMQKDSALLQKRNALAVFERPQFKFEQDKWSTTRELNVDELGKLWAGNPNRVRVLVDRKLGPSSMVMLRKDTFEQMVKILEDLLHGEAVIRTNMSAIFSSIKLIEKLIEPEAQKDTPLYHAVHTLSQVAGTVHSVVEFSMPPRNVRPSKLSAKEIEELRKIQAEEKE